MGSTVPDRKRDRFYKIFKATNASPRPITLNLAQTSPQTPPSSQRNDPFLLDALKLLTEQEQTLIQQYVTNDSGTTLQAAYNAADAQKKLCEQNRWPGSERADRVLHWLDRFKSVGDLAVNADPIHAGLPWAGIRVLLEVAIADSRQMSALVAGMDVALYMINRLQAYFHYYRNLPPPPALTTTNLRKALINLYARVLGFLASAIKIYLMNKATRKVQALWQQSDITTFEERCDREGTQVNIEADNCDRELRASEGAVASQWKRNLDSTLQLLQSRMQASFDNLHVKVDLSRLSIAQQATYNSTSEEKNSFCLDGTRTEILDSIQQWADSSNGKFIFWLCGKAGTGKSTISRTVAQRFNKPSRPGERPRLAASFFFKRGEQDRSNADLFFPTIAMQVADLIPEMRVPLSKALDADSFLHGRGRGLQEQFEKLFLEPLKYLDNVLLPSQNMLIVIDALDECDGDMDIRQILWLLARVGTETALRLRILLTSRPELPVRIGFRRLDADGNQHIHQDIMLEEVQEQTIGRDIRAYFKAEFAKIRQERDDDPSLKHWPSEADLEVLVDRAVPLFIFASTVCRFVSERKPYTRLQAILTAPDTALISHVAQTYLPILNHLLLNADLVSRNEIIQDFRKFVGPIILAVNPLSITSLAGLLGIQPERIAGEIGEIFDRLHSVLDIPSNRDGPIRLLHLSFRDFLIDHEREDKEGFWINEVETHRDLARSCIRRLSENGVLMQDICRVSQPGTRRTEIAMQQVRTHLAPDVAYACSYWPLHFVKGKEHILDDSPVHNFLQQHFLHWLEALSWLGKLSLAVAYISELSSACQDDKSFKVLSFLYDAKRFILQHRYVIDLAPLQTYYSAMIFSPTQSVVRQTFSRHVHQPLEYLSKMVENWSAEIQKLEGHDWAVNAVAFSPNEQTIVSASADKTVRLWDAITGEQMQTLNGHDDIVNSVAFSQDGRTIASASSDRTVRLWDAATGEQRQTLKGHDDWVCAVAFSPDGQTIASASHDKTVRLWDAATGEQRQMLKGHKDIVHAVAFSPDGQTIASASHDKTVRLWDAATGEQRQTLKGHDDWVRAVTFSLDGQTIASASGDKTVRLWDAATGKQRQMLKGHKDIVLAVTFSPDGQTIASASHDKTVRLWDAATGEQRQTLKRHDEWVRAVTFSLDGQTIASASHDKTVRLWDAATGEQRQTLKGHDDWVRAVTFSPDGQAVASASHDNTVRLWDAATGMMIQLIPDVGSITDITISSDGRHLRTNTGTYSLENNLSRSSPMAPIRTTSLELVDKWIRHKDKDILWLPHEYRGRCSAMHGQSLVIGQISGAVDIFRLALSSDTA